jgi:hypothetical protein
MVAIKLQEGQMNVGAVLVADLQAPEAVEPGEGAFNHPAVAAQSVLGLDAATGNARVRWTPTWVTAVGNFKALSQSR